MALSKAKYVVRKTLFSCKKVRIPVPWGQISGKWYGPTDQRPILTLHGWMDNCGSMDRLINHLEYDNKSFLSIDFPGHGHSSKYPFSMYYDYKDFATCIHYIKQYFDWEKLSLMGHSFGSGIGYLYSTFFPNNIDFLICLETTKVPIRPQNNIYMAQAIENFIKYDKFVRSEKEPPSFTYDYLKQNYIKLGIKEEYVHYILDRNIGQSVTNPGKYYILTDPRVKCHGFFNFPQCESIEYAADMKFPMFIGKTKDGGYWEDEKNFYEVLAVNKKFSEDCDFHFVDGNHYLHLNNPEIFGELIKKFLKRHLKNNRCVQDVSSLITVCGE